MISQIQTTLVSQILDLWNLLHWTPYIHKKQDVETYFIRLKLEGMDCICFT
jgi:hypothetical protein